MVNQILNELYARLRYVSQGLPRKKESYFHYLKIAKKSASLQYVRKHCLNPHGGSEKTFFMWAV